MNIFVPSELLRQFSYRNRIFHIKSVIFLLCLNVCLKLSAVIAVPTSQQEQELLLLEALSKRQPNYYGTSNSVMDILGRSMFPIFSFFFSLFIFFKEIICCYYCCSAVIFLR